MKPRVVKRETATQLELTLKLFVDTVQLRLDKVLCLKCDICARVCPRDAVSIIPSDDGLDISIDPRLCLMCEICAHFCPVAAVTLSYNGQVKTIMADHQGLAPFLPKIDMDKSRCLLPCPTQPEGEEHWCRQQIKLVPNDLTECPKQCHKCLAACPRQAIVLDEAAGQTMPAPDLCLRCTQCLTVCEYEAIVRQPPIPRPAGHRRPQVPAGLRQVYRALPGEGHRPGGGPGLVPGGKLRLLRGLRQHLRRRGHHPGPGGSGGRGGRVFQRLGDGGGEIGE